MDSVSIAVARGMVGGEADRIFRNERRAIIRRLNELQGIKEESESWLLRNKGSAAI